MAELPLFDHAAAAQARDEAIARVTYHADPVWLATALKAVHRLAVDRLSFTTDDIWARAEAAEDLPHEPRALGNVMRRAAREGWILPTAEYTPSSRVASHGRPVRVWRSLVWRGSQ